MNALVKRYVNSKNEISDFIRFLASFEQDSRFEEEKLFNEASNLAKNEVSKEKKLGKDERNCPSLKEEKNSYESHPIMLDLKEKISKLIFQKHLGQFTLSHYYLCKLKKSDLETSIFEIKNSKTENTKRWREVMISANKYSCVCPTYCRHGIICRHIFALAVMFQDKTSEKLILHPRWIKPSIAPTEIENYNFDK